VVLVSFRPVNICSSLSGNLEVFARKADGFKGLVRSISYKWSFSGLFGTKRRNAAFRFGTTTLWLQANPLGCLWAGSRTAKLVLPSWLLQLQCLMQL
jgi:hypothetical protein